MFHSGEWSIDGLLFFSTILGWASIRVYTVLVRWTREIRIHVYIIMEACSHSHQSIDLYCWSKTNPSLCLSTTPRYVYVKWINIFTPTKESEPNATVAQPTLLTLKSLGIIHFFQTHQKNESTGSSIGSAQSCWLAVCCEARGRGRGPSSILLAARCTFGCSVKIFAPPLIGIGTGSARAFSQINTYASSHSPAGNCNLHKARQYELSILEAFTLYCAHEKIYVHRVPDASLTVFDNT